MSDESDWPKIPEIEAKALTVLKLEVTINTLRDMPTAEFRAHVFNKISIAVNRALNPLMNARYLSGISMDTLFPSSDGSFAPLHPGDVKTGNPLIQKAEN